MVRAGHGLFIAFFAERGAGAVGSHDDGCHGFARSVRNTGPVRLFAQGHGAHVRGDFRHPLERHAALMAARQIPHGAASAGGAVLGGKHCREVQGGVVRDAGAILQRAKRAPAFCALIEVPGEGDVAEEGLTGVGSLTFAGGPCATAFQRLAVGIVAGEDAFHDPGAGGVERQLDGALSFHGASDLLTPWDAHSEGHERAAIGCGVALLVG